MNIYDKCGINTNFSIEITYLIKNILSFESEHLCVSSFVLVE